MFASSKLSKFNWKQALTGPGAPGSLDDWHVVGKYNNEFVVGMQSHSNGLKFQNIVQAF